jgi:hypothetical protein
MQLYGISDVRLGKVCRILLVPMLPLGYWDPLRRGGDVRRQALRKFLAE